MNTTENPKSVDEQLNELEARVIAQEHRAPHILLNFVRRNSFNSDDPRHSACWQAAIYRGLTFFLPSSPAGALGWGTAIAIVISWWTLGTMEEQKKIERRAALFQQTQQIQLVFIERPELRIQFYSNKKLELDAKQKARLDTIVEMMGDLLDHAAASDLGARTDAAWG